MTTSDLARRHGGHLEVVDEHVNNVVAIHAVDARVGSAGVAVPIVDIAVGVIQLGTGPMTLSLLSVSWTCC